ncbi:glycosyltransferase family 4 protein [Cytophagaceae bacterium ABcell3]|nr:glycosyltransferase family 4 protein [Cytophagaceae bacterium ABcell3]
MSKVLVFTTQIMETGGIESHLNEFCLHFSKAGSSIDLVVLNSCMSLETESFLRKRCRKVYVCKIGKSHLRIAWLFLLGLRLFFNKYNALYTNGQGSSIELIASMIRRSVWVHHHHTSGDEADQNTWSSSYKRSLLRADTVVACSKINATDITLALARNVKVVTCFSRKVIVEKPLVTKSSNIVRFGYYGRLIPEKGISTLCQLSLEPELENTEFHIWGAGPAYPPSYFLNYPSVGYHGSFYGLEGLQTVVSSIDAFLLLSVHPEGLPICLLEAMSAGLPWLATNKGGISDIAFDPMATRVVDATADYQELKEYVVDFANDIRAGKMNKQSQVNMYDLHFSSDALVKQWKQVLTLS